MKHFRHYGHPFLKEVNGLLNIITLAFAFFNLLLGAALYFNSATTNDFFIVTSLFTYQFWGAAFFLGGASLLIGHILNYWSLMRNTLLVMLFVKFVWLAALVFRQIVDLDSNVFLLLFFALSAVVEIAIYVYFPIFNKVSTWKE